jgi:hypothetical protein
MVAGLFLMKNRPFQKAVIAFFILNTWIIISWSDWRYGGTYSSRALLQGCAVLALPLAVLVEKTARSRWKTPAAALGIFLVFLNLFQLWQFQSGVLHYNDMNLPYYRAIFLDPKPTPLDMSLLDTREILRNEAGFDKKNVFSMGDSSFVISAKTNAEVLIGRADLQDLPPGKERWLHVSAEVRSAWGAFGAQLVTEFQPVHGEAKSTACRLENGICKKGEWNRIEYYFKLPDEAGDGHIRIFTKATGEQEIELRRVKADWLSR